MLKNSCGKVLSRGMVFAVPQAMEKERGIDLRGKLSPDSGGEMIRFAEPWWVNLLIAVPVALWFVRGKGAAGVGKKRLAIAGLFGIAFGLVEAAVVIYLRAAGGQEPALHSSALAIAPKYLLRFEVWREAATMIMLGAIAWLAGQSAKEKALAFFWTFAWWDLAYYGWLRVAIGWPQSLLTPDVLFLIPVPWLGQVWFPILVSGLTAAAIWRRA